ncbi:MAG: hypothetical protein WAX69_25055, partial [Victivallales bacterium]
ELIFPVPVSSRRSDLNQVCGIFYFNVITGLIETFALSPPEAWAMKSMRVHLFTFTSSPAVWVSPALTFAVKRACSLFLMRKSTSVFSAPVKVQEILRKNFSSY